MRRALAATFVIAVTACAAAGCGGGGGGGSGSASGAAGLVPPDALAFVTVNTDLGSSQDQAAAAVLDKFPFKDKLLAAIEKGIAKSGVDLNALKSSVGPEVDVAVLLLNGKPTPVGFTQPKDEKTFDGQLDAAKKPLVHDKISGWTVFAQSSATFDAINHRSGNLSDVQAFKDATASVPSAGDAIATAYVAPGALQKAASSLPAQGSISPGAFGLGNVKWLSAAATSHDDGVELEAHAKGLGGTGSPSVSTLAAQIPSGALLALSLHNPGSLLTKIGSAAPVIGGVVQSALGDSLQDLGNALSGDTILYVRPGAPVPEATLATMPADPQAAAKTAGTLIATLSHAKPVSANVGGFPFHRFALGPIDLFYGVFNKELVVTDSANAVAELKSTSGKLASDPTFSEAKKAAGMPDATQGFLYVNVKDSLPTVEGIARLANKTIPASIDANLKPLRSLLIYGSHSGSTETFVAFLQTG